jgi:hypothetical protein
MGRKLKILGFVVCVVIIVGIVLVLMNKESITDSVIHTGSSGGNDGRTYVSVPPVDITYENIEEELPKHYVIRELPEDGILLLRFYNFDSGEREWEKSYIIRKGIMGEGYSEDVDLVLYIYSGYIEELNNRNFCEVIKKANANGDLGYEIKMSSLGFGWKYRGMNKYKECFGM